MHRSDLLADGVTDAEIKSARGSGAWSRLHRGVYCATDSLTGLTEEERYRVRSIAVARRSPNLVASHHSAAAMLGLPLWRAPFDRVHLIRVAGGGGRSGPGRVVHMGQLAPAEIRLVEGTRITSPARTLIDVACCSSWGTTVVAADAALRRALITPGELATALAQTQHRRGASDARRALRFADGRCESVGESLLRVAMHDARLPTPELQIRIIRPDGSVVARADLGYPELGVLIEFDGAIKYSKLLRAGQSAHEAVLAEKIREDRLRDLGYVVVRVIWAELGDPPALAAKINAALTRGRKVVAAAGIAGTWSTDPAVRITR